MGRHGTLVDMSEQFADNGCCVFDSHALFRGSCGCCFASEKRIGEAAARAGVSLTTVKRMEGTVGPERSSAGNLEAVTGTLEAAGVVFLSTGDTPDGGPGVRLAE